MPAFKLASIVVANTRAAHEDTDYVCAMLSINGKIATRVVKIDGVNNGPIKSAKTYPVNFAFDDFPSWNNQDQFVFTYMVINHGGDKTDKVTADCISALTQTALKDFDPNAAATTPGNATPVCLRTKTLFGDDLKALWNVAKPDFKGIDNNRCDGPVAMAHFSFLGSTLAAVTLQHEPDGLIHMNHFGIDSAVGCGSNSHYGVAWELTAD